LNEARVGGRKGILKAREALSDEVETLQAAMDQTKSAIAMENEHRDAKAEELLKFEKEIESLDQAKVQLKERCDEELERRQREHQNTLLQMLRGVDTTAETAEENAEKAGKAEQNSDSASDSTAESVDNPESDPKNLRLQVWAELSNKKVEDLIYFIGGNSSVKGARLSNNDSKRRSTMAGSGGRTSRASVATGGRRSTVKRVTVTARPSVSIPNTVEETVIADAENQPPPSAEEKKAQLSRQKTAVGAAKKYLSENETIE
jgi:hypothetical protein